MSLNELFGTNPEMRFRNIEIIRKKTKKWGIVMAILYGLLSLSILTMPHGSDSGFFSMILGILYPLAMVFGAYWIGKAYGWGWYWLRVRGYDKHELAKVGSQCISDTFWNTWLFGSTSFWVAIIVLLIFVAIGFYAGLISMIHYGLEYHRLKNKLAGAGTPV